MLTSMVLGSGEFRQDLRTQDVGAGVMGSGKVDDLIDHAPVSYTHLIDRLNQVILKNAIMASRPRWFVRQDGIVNEEEYADWDRDFVHYTGSGDPEEHLSLIHI